MNTTKLAPLILIGGALAVVSVALLFVENRPEAPVLAQATHRAEAHTNGTLPARSGFALPSGGSAEKSGPRLEPMILQDGLAAEGRTALWRGPQKLQPSAPPVPPPRDLRPRKNLPGEVLAAGEQTLSRPRQQAVVRQLAPQRPPDAARATGGWDAAAPTAASAEAFIPVGPTPVNVNAPGNSLASGSSRVGVDSVEPMADGSMALGLIVAPSSESPPAKNSVLAGGFTLEEEIFRARWGWSGYEEAGKLARDASR
jgi:hypothetical protein